MKSAKKKTRSAYVKMLINVLVELLVYTVLFILFIITVFASLKAVHVATGYGG